MAINGGRNQPMCRKTTAWRRNNGENRLCGAAWRNMAKMKKRKWRKA
jgi:hypothetical protein